MGISSFTLDNFRSYDKFSLSNLGKFVLLLGPNGSGKTNILEAISMIAPGRGLKATNTNDLQKFETKAPWTVHVRLDDDNAIGLQSSVDYKRKLVRLNQANMQKHSEVLDIIRVVWITPSMDDIVADTSSIRRKFIDRMAYNFFPNHATLTIEYEHAQKERSKLLKGGIADDIWLSKLESLMADRGVAIANNRLNSIKMVNERLSEFESSFPKPVVSMIGFVEENIANPNILQLIKDNLKERRYIDTKAKRTTFGVHRSELQIIDSAKNISAKFCSTGEQKALTIALIIAQLRAMRAMFDGHIIVLLDDIFSHLDEARRDDLLNELDTIDVQCFITATEHFSEIKNCTIHQFY